MLSIFAPKEKWVVGGLAVLALTTISLLLLTQDKNTSQDPPPTPQPQASLQLATSAQKPAVNETFPVQVLLDNQSLSIDAVDIVLTYDTNSLEVVSVEPNDLFAIYPVQSNNREKGEISISGFSLPQTDGASQAVTQSGTFGTVMFKPIKPGSSAIRFSPLKTIVAGQKEKLPRTTEDLVVVIN